MVLQSLAHLEQESRGFGGLDLPPTKSKVLAYGIDTLCFTAGGKVIASDWLKEQQDIWKEYCDTFEIGDDEMSIQLPDGEWWRIKPFGNGVYKYQLFNKEIGYIKIWNCDKWIGGMKGKQQLHIQLYSKALHQNSGNLMKFVNQLVSYFFSGDGVEIKVSRLDLYSDVCRNAFLSEEEVSNTISRSKFREQIFGGDDNEYELTEKEEKLVESWGKNQMMFPTLSLGDSTNSAGSSSSGSANPDLYNKGEQKLTDELVGKLIGSYMNRMVSGADSIIRKRDLETAYFGRFSSDVLCRMYNKSKEVKYKGDSDTPLRWLDNGWDNKQEVIRVEFSMKRAFIRQLNDEKYVSLNECVKNVNNIWDYLTNSWLRMVDEVKENNSQNSVITSFWRKVQFAFGSAVSNVIRSKNYQAKIDLLLSQGIGCLKQMIAIGMNNNDDTCYINSAVQGVNDILLSTISSRDYYQRRIKLGIA